MTKEPLHLDLLVYFQDGEYVAHCLQMDIVATAASQDQVVEDMIDLVRAQIDFAIKNDNLENIFRPAPPEVWELLMRAHIGGDPKCERLPIMESENRLKYGPTVCYA